jgi:hypothetical protein
MLNAISEDTIHSHPSRSRGEDDGDPFQKNTAKAQPSQNLKEKRPGNRVKSSSEVEFNKHTFLPPRVDLPSQLSHQDEIIMQTASSDKGWLIWTDKIS